MNSFQITLLILTIAFTMIYGYLRKSLNYFKDLGILHIPPWPIVGNMGPIILGKKHIFRVIQDAYDLHPEAKYVGFYNFMTPTIIIRDPELIKSVTITNFNHFTDRCTTDERSYKPFGIFFMRGDKWRQTRNTLSPTFSSCKLKTMFSLITECAENATNFIEGELLNKETVVYIKDIFTKYTNDVIASCAFGMTVNTFKNPNNDFYVNGQKMVSTEGIFNIKLYLHRAFPKFMEMISSKIGPYKTLIFFRSVIKKVIEQRDKNQISRSDMLQILMDARENTDKKLTLSINDISMHALSFYFAGYDTSSSLTSHIARNLMLHPNVQSKLQDEIDEVMRRTNGNISYADIKSMTYLDAVITETNRRHMATFLERVCVKDFQMPPALPGLEPFTVKAGTMLCIPIDCIHSDPKYYHDPSTFDPERVYKNKVCTNQTTSLTFGTGPRMCIGSRFALLETKILFFYLMAKYNLKPCAKSNMRLSEKKKLFSSFPQGKFWMKIEARNKLV